MRVENYHLSLVLDAPQPGYHGVVEIEAADLPADVALNARDLTPGKVTLNGKELPVEVREAEQEWVLKGAPATAQGRLRVEFKGAASQTGLEGYYRSRYGDGHIFTTDFEPTAARHFFPCFDRPDLKGTFHVEVEAEKDLTVIFNTPAEETRVSGSRKHWRFAPTPRMSTYLFYLGVGPFQEVSNRQFRVPVTVALPAGREKEGAFAGEAGAKLLKAYEEYYGIPYPLPKMHFIAVPEYGPGAMENWGAITFREMLLLQGTGSTVNLRRTCASVISHELAHQWFGDLVTMAWWNDLWLNESFATFVGTKMQDKVFPDHESFNDFLLLRTTPALRLDGLSGSHPIQVEVKHPEEIRQVFDNISYGKGASVLRMTEAFLGEKDFRAGITAYLKAFSYGNARSADLWTKLTEASGQPVDRILGVWTGQPGYPVIQVHREGSSVALEQGHFLYRGKGSDRIWPVPVTYRHGSREGRFLLEGRKGRVPLEGPGLFLLNLGRTGFYRVRYDEEGYRQLREGFSSLAATDRWGLLDDLYAFLQAGTVDFGEYRSFVETALGSPDYLLVSQLQEQLATLARLMEYRGPVAELERKFLSRQRTRLGTDPRPGETTNDAALREPLFNESAVAEPEVAAMLAGRFPRYEEEDPALRQAVLTGYVREGGPQAFEELIGRLLKEKRDEEGVRLMTALAQTKEPAKVEELVSLTLSGKVSRNYLVYGLLYSARNPEGTVASWEAGQRHWKEVLQVLSGTPVLSQLPEFGIPVWGLRRPAEVRKFFQDQPHPEMARGIRNGLERLAMNEDLRSRLPKD